MKRNKHSLSHYKLFSADMGELIPIACFEVLPGDTIQHVTSALIRAAPLVSPVMHPLVVRIHHWYVPYRMIWSSWEDFITGGPNGTSTPAFPVINASTAVGLGTLADYFGIPVSVAAGTQLSALPWRAYAKIWNENYRDEDLETAAVISTADGLDTTTSIVKKNISWEKDYFTSSRPWEQKGPQVTLPLGTRAPVSGLGVAPGTTFPNAGTVVKDATTTSAGVAYPSSNTSATSQLIYRGQSSGATGIPDIYADLANATAASVNLLRQAFSMQRFEEARARFGSRYVEYLRYLGVRSSDARLQRPEYLGGGKQTIQFSEVLQTGPSASPDQANVVGALKGHGIGAMRSNRYRRFIEEHGLVMSLMSVRPKTIYMDGIPRMYSQRTKEDFWQKEYEHIGQQPILNSEIYAAHATPGGTFGYQDRYDQYRRLESSVSGEFRSTLNYWHMARSFGSAPALNASFVSCVPTLRTFASATTDPLYVMANHSIQARRLVARTGRSFIF